VDLAPEFPALDGDSGKTAGVVIFFVAALQTAYGGTANFRFVSARNGGLSTQVGFARF